MLLEQKLIELWQFNARIEDVLDELNSLTIRHDSSQRHQRQATKRPRHLRSTEGGDDTTRFGRARCVPRIRS